MATYQSGQLWPKSFFLMPLEAPLVKSLTQLVSLPVAVQLKIPHVTVPTEYH